MQSCSPVIPEQEGNRGKQLSGIFPHLSGTGFSDTVVSNFLIRTKKIDLYR
jgi:hypothetical protein